MEVLKTTSPWAGASAPKGDAPDSRGFEQASDKDSGGSPGLVLILLLELVGAPAWQLHLIGSALILGRIVHAWSLTAHSGSGRLIGITLTFFVLVAGALGTLKVALVAMIL